MPLLTRDSCTLTVTLHLGRLLTVVHGHSQGVQWVHLHPQGSEKIV